MVIPTNQEPGWPGARLASASYRSASASDAAMLVGGTDQVRPGATTEVVHLTLEGPFFWKLMALFFFWGGESSSKFKS